MSAKFTVDISDADLELVLKLLEHVNHDEHGNQIDFCSHGPLTIEKLAAMLLQDVALAWRRPGSWEGTNMATVLQGHGYSL